MTFSEIAHRRLQAQQLISTPLHTAAEMVAWFGAVQGQEYGPTKWSLGMRLPHLKEADIEQELTAGKIVRTHFPRPTWHFVAAEDIRWLLLLTAPRVRSINATMYRQTGLDAATFSACNKLIEKTLEGGRHLTREALNEVFAAHGIVANGIRLSYIMMNAELVGLVCSGPRQGNQFTYMLLEERVPPVPSKTHEEALVEITQRYFRSRGPATVKDFSTWSGLTVAECKRGIKLTEGQFEQVTVEGKPYYFAPEKLLPQKKYQRLHFLSIYDEYIMGYQDRSPIFLVRNSFPTPPKVAFDNTIAWDGQLIGTWKRSIGSKAIQMEWNFFQPLTDVQQAAVHAEMRRYSEFMGMEVKYP
jgi:hypothetical protein